MRITIDAAGRLVIPKAIRDAAGLEAGDELDVELRDGRIEIEPAPRQVRLVDAPHGAVIEIDPPPPPLTADEVRAVLERLRR